MHLDSTVISQLAIRLESAELEAYAIPKITDDYPEMDWDDAYAIQEEIRRQKEARGCKTVGLKAGLTSFAKMKQMGVDTPCFGLVFDYMGCPDGGRIQTKKLIHPKVEAEICIVTKLPLRGPNCNVSDVLAATDFVVPAVEVIDSRYRDFSFDLKSVIADNTSASRFVCGKISKKIDTLDLSSIRVVLEKNGEIVSMATGAAVLGHPAEAVAMMANHLSVRGQEIPAGTFIMTGGVTEAISVEVGDSVHASFESLGSVTMRFI